MYNVMICYMHTIEICTWCLNKDNKMYFDFLDNFSF